MFKHCSTRKHSNQLADRYINSCQFIVMKIISWVLNILLLGPLAKLVWVATQLYRHHDDLHGYAISNSQVYEFEKPYIILSGIFALVFLISIVLNIKKKYLISIVLNSLAFVYFFIVLALNNI